MYRFKFILPILTIVLQSPSWAESGKQYYSLHQSPADTPNSRRLNSLWKVSLEKRNLAEAARQLISHKYVSVEELSEWKYFSNERSLHHISKYPAVVLDQSTAKYYSTLTDGATKLGVAYFNFIQSRSDKKYSDQNLQAAKVDQEIQHEGTSNEALKSAIEHAKSEVDSCLKVVHNRREALVEVTNEDAVSKLEAELSNTSSGP